MPATKGRTQISIATRGVALLVLLLVLLFSASRSGLSSLMTSYAAVTSQIAPASTAVLLDASNPDAHYVRGTILESADLPAAVAEYLQAALARPDDYVLWLSLARARELNGETEGAVAAARQAIPLAPEYAEPHYQLGNILLRAGQTEEAFKELRRAGGSNPMLLPGIVDLAWRFSNRDLKYVERVLGPGTPQLYLAMAQYFRQHEEAEAATTMYLAAGSIADENRRSYVGELINAKRFKEAARLWAVDWPDGAKAGVIFDPGFERESNLKDKGFSWGVREQYKGFRLSLDSNQPREGRSSLRVDFDGDSDPGAAVIYQFVMVEPGAHYQLSLAVRTENVVSGGMPQIVVLDGVTYQLLAQSEQFPQTSSGWREYKIDFEPGQSANTVQIALRRQPCAVAPCPIFGRLWLDNLSLEKS